MMHHPHVHMIVPGGGLSPDGAKWIRASAKFLLPVRVLSALFRRRMIEALVVAHKAGKLVFFSELASLVDAAAFADRAQTRPLSRPAYRSSDRERRSSSCFRTFPRLKHSHVRRARRLARSAFDLRTPGRFATARRP